jgi:hypothetical protein
MKKFFSLSWLAVVCAALVMVPGLLRAQESGDAEELDNPLNPTQPRAKLLIGPRGGINRNYHTGGFRTIEGVNCPKFESGTGWGYFGGLTAEFVAGKSWSIIPALTYESRPGHFRQELPEAAVLLEGGGGIPVNQSISTTSDITYQLLGAEVMYKQEFVTLGKSFRVSVAGGPVASLVMGGKITQVQDLNEPENARFTNPDGLPTDYGGRRLIFSDNADIPGRNSIRFSLKAGLQAEVGLFHNAWIMYPGIYYDFGLSHVTSLENWNLNTVLFQIDFRRAF